MKKPKLKIEQHLKIARSFCPARDFISKLVCELSRAYPNNSRVVKSALKASAAIEKLKFELDECVCKENRDLSDDVCRIYYGDDNEYRQGKKSIGARR